jgi:hypothetical protein
VQPRRQTNRALDGLARADGQGQSETMCETVGYPVGQRVLTRYHAATGHHPLDSRAACHQVGDQLTQGIGTPLDRDPSGVRARGRGVEDRRAQRAHQRAGWPCITLTSSRNERAPDRTSKIGSLREL